MQDYCGCVKYIHDLVSNIIKYYYCKDGWVGRAVEADTITHLKTLHKNSEHYPLVDKLLILSEKHITSSLHLASLACLL